MSSTVFWPQLFRRRPTTRDRPFASRLARRVPCRHRSHPNARDERALLQRVQRPKIRKSLERRRALVAAVAAAAVAEAEAAAAEARARSQRRLVARRDAQRPRSRPVQPQLPPRRVKQLAPSPAKLRIGAKRSQRLDPLHFYRSMSPVRSKNAKLQLCGRLSKDPQSRAHPNRFSVVR